MRASRSTWPGASPIEHTGRVLHEILGTDAKVSQADPAKPATQIPGMASGVETSNASETEADEMEEHVRGLGYLE